MRFEWDQRKAKANLRKHGVSFEEASTVFVDPAGKQSFDLSHSDHEDRFVQLGRSNKIDCFWSGTVIEAIKFALSPPVKPLQSMKLTI